MSIYDREPLGEAGELPEIAPRARPRRSLLVSPISWRGVVAVILAVVVLRVWVMESVIVDGDSMSSTLLTDEWALVLKPVKPHRFSVIVFADPEEQTTAIKRVVGMPGDAVMRLPNVPGERRVRPGTPISINDTAYYEPYARYSGPGIIKPTDVPEGTYFVLGDNRGDSADSRTYGPIPQDSVRGVAVAVVYPFSHMRLIRNWAEEAADGG